MFRWIAVGRAHTPKRNTVFLTHNNLVVWVRVYTYTGRIARMVSGLFCHETRGPREPAASAWLGARLHREYIRIIQKIIHA